jgi:hypothetical protein
MAVVLICNPGFHLGCHLVLSYGHMDYSFGGSIVIQIIICYWYIDCHLGFHLVLSSGFCILDIIRVVVLMVIWVSFCIRFVIWVII